MAESKAISTMETSTKSSSPPSKTIWQVPNSVFYFCIPQNDQLLGYWDTVADRLFKIRHCMNIEGVVRQLPLFEPPIDPALLVKARAMGLDLGSVLNDLYAPLPHYRFVYLLQKAVEFCSEVKSLGAALLSALEKKDAEELALLRSSHELALLDAVKEIRKQQIAEAEEGLEGLRRSRMVTEARHVYYKDIVKINANEQLHMDSLGTAHTFNQIAQVISMAASIAHGVPQFDVGTAPGGIDGGPRPIVKVVYGGNHVGSSLQAIASLNNFIAAQHTHDATMASIKGGYDRRWEEWKLQEKLANKELTQIDKQIVAAEIRVAIAERELENHDLQIENARQVDDYMRNKFTNQELYSWMTSQISAIYFQSYKLAYDIAKRAEQAHRYELGLTDSSFIQFGYWDSLKKGLLAGERLSHDLKRLEMAYLDRNKREYEITKHISLTLVNPEALIKLRETGACEFDIAELLFDLDFPGQYMRRIKSVSLTIPCVTGPYTNVSAKLTLLSNRTRRTSNVSGGYAYTLDDLNGDRFVHNWLGIRSIATSSAQNDHGMFELNFRDERYLPFEGAGVISRWRLELPAEFRHFDYDTISDVVIHMSHTARDGGDVFKSAVTTSIQDAINKWLNILAEEETGIPRLFSLKHEFPNAFHKLLNPTGPTQEATFEVARQHFPYLLHDRELAMLEATVYLKPKAGKPLDTGPLIFKINGAGGDTITWNDYGDLKMGNVSLPGDPIGIWTVDAGTNGLDKDVLDDILILLKYTLVPA